MPTSPVRPDTACTSLADLVANRTRSLLEQLVAQPDVTFSERALGGFEAALGLVEVLAAVPAGNGSAAYRVQNLGGTVAEDVATARHLLKMLQAIHGPKAEPLPTECGWPVTVWDGDQCIRPKHHDGDHVSDHGLRRPLDAEPLNPTGPAMTQAEYDAELAAREGGC